MTAKRQVQFDMQTAHKKRSAALLDRARAHHRRGELDQAEKLYQRILQQHPGAAEPVHLLGLLALHRQEHARARRLLEHSVTLQPEVAGFHFNLAKLYDALGEEALALQALRRAIQLNPDFADAYMDLALLLEQRGDADHELIALYSHLQALRPDEAWIYNNLANVQKKLGHHAHAIRNYRRAMEKDPSYTTPCLNLGILYQECGDSAAALQAFEETVARGDAGDRDTAVAERLIAYGSGSADAPRVRKLEERLNLPDTGTESRTHLHFALGRHHEKLGHFEQAFAHYRSGNAIARASLRFDITQHEALADGIRQWFTAERLAALRGHSDTGARPVFIVGMPRSGSTLTEQILASHPHVSGGGETRLLEHVLFRSEATVNAWGFPHTLDDQEPGLYPRLATRYLDAIAQLSPGTPVITNKMLMNFFYIGIIHVLFPQARIIHCRRDPVDTCLSCYTSYFAGGEPGFAFDLEELGRYYRLYSELMQHWQRVLPDGTLHELVYEQLIDDPNTQIRALLDYTGLDWHDDCLAFHSTQRDVLTASQQQVRKPLYRDSIARSRHYREQLQPLRTLLGETAPLETPGRAAGS